MDRIWTYMMIAAAIFSIVSGRSEQAAEALLNSGAQAVELTLALVGTMSLWSGVMEILAETGGVRFAAKHLRRMASPLFPGITDKALWEAMGTNLAANLLGLGNAATPAGVRASQLLGQQGECGVRALAMLLVLNNAGVQLIPTTVISMRQAAGSGDAAGIWLPSAAAALVSAVVGVAVLLVLQRREGEQ